VRVEDETERIRGAQWAARLFVTHCRDIENNLNDLRQNIDQELSQVHEQLDAVHSSRGRKNRDLASHALGALRQVCKLRLHEYVAASAGSVIQVVKGQVSSTQDELMDLERELRHLATQFDTSRTLDHNADDQHDALDDLAESIGQVLVDNVEQLANQLQCKLRDEVMQLVGGLHGLLMQSSDKRNKLPALMRGVARVTVVGILKQLDASDILFHDGEAPRTEVEKLAECLDAARPRLLACGGAKRLLVVLPKGSSQARPIEILHHEMNETPSVVENCEGDFILCYEAEQVSLTQAAVSFIDGRSDLAEAALRLHTRNDVNWSHLPDLVS